MMNLETSAANSLPASAVAPDVTPNEVTADPPADAPKMRAATHADAAPLAYAVGREINRRIRAIVDQDDNSDDPFALATVGRNADQGRKRILISGLNGLKSATDRYTAVYQAFLTACDELKDATEQACAAVNVNVASVAASLNLEIRPDAGNGPMSDLVRERKEREIKEREIAEQIAATKRDAKVKIAMAREARDAANASLVEARRALKADK
jgi:hypothetical protein